MPAVIDVAEKQPTFTIPEPFFFINYGTDQEIARREKQIRGQIPFRDDDAPRITMVRGGDPGTPKTVLWIVPPGAEPPKP